MSEPDEFGSNASPFLFIKEAAAYIRCNPEVLRRWALRNRIKFGRVGPRMVFRREWLDAYVEGRKARW